MANNVISTIDLWLPDDEHRFEIYDKAFRAGLDTERAKRNKAISHSYDKIEFYENCNAAINFPLLRLDHRHTAILFYKDGQPIRLLLDDIPLDKVKQCYNHASAQYLLLGGRYQLQRTLEQIETKFIDLKEEPLHCRYKEFDHPQITSCDRWDLFLQLIDNMKENKSAYSFNPFNIFNVTVKLTDWEFKISHHGMFYSEELQHYIAMQSLSPLTS